MPPGPTSVARIRLARSAGRLFALPAGLVLAAVAVGALAVPGPLPAGEPARYASLAIAGGLVLAAAAIVLRVLSIRLDVEEAAVRLHWLGGERRYRLAPGPVTRVRLVGENASQLRARSRWLGWSLGRARLREEEDIEIVRLAPTATVILVPTERGRLGIAATSEEQLIDALSRAARARERLEQLAAAASAAPSEADAASEEADAPEPERARVLTGIERALLEERLARGREEAQAATQLAPAAPPAEAATSPHLSAIAPAPASTPAAASPGRWRVRGRRVARIGTPGPSWALVLVPILGAGIVWGAATTLGRLPDPASDLGRLTSLALVLAGPAAAIGAIMARAWWPRIVGVVVTGGLVGSVFVGRALLGA